MPQPQVYDNPSNSEADVITFHSVVTFAVASLGTQRTKAQAVLARTGVGTYTFTLPRAYPRFLGVYASWLSRTGIALQPIVTSDLSGTTGVITFKLADGTGAAVEPATTEKVALEFRVSGMP